MSAYHLFQKILYIEVTSNINTIKVWILNSDCHAADYNWVVYKKHVFICWCLVWEWNSKTEESRILRYMWNTLPHTDRQILGTYSWSKWNQTTWWALLRRPQVSPDMRIHTFNPSIWRRSSECLQMFTSSLN